METAPSSVGGLKKCSLLYSGLMQYARTDVEWPCVESQADIGFTTISVRAAVERIDGRPVQSLRIRETRQDGRVASEYNVDIQTGLATHIDPRGNTQNVNDLEAVAFQLLRASQGKKVKLESSELSYI